MEPDPLDLYLNACLNSGVQSIPSPKFAGLRDDKNPRKIVRENYPIGDRFSDDFLEVRQPCGVSVKGQRVGTTRPGVESTDQRIFKFPSATF